MFKAFFWACPFNILERLLFFFEILDKEEYILRLFLRIVFLHQEPTFLEMAETVATAVFNYPTSVNKLPQPDLLLQIICQVSGRIASYVKVA